MKSKSHRAKARARRRDKRSRPLPPIPSVLHDDMILPWPVWLQVAGLPDRSARRLVREGNGPIITQLSERRPGVRVLHHRQWADARARGA
jgi:hypothetical protein